MKKLFLSVLAIAAMATTANAQLWFGAALVSHTKAALQKLKKPILTNHQLTHSHSHRWLGLSLTRNFQLVAKLISSARRRSGLLAIPTQKILHQHSVLPRLPATLLLSSISSEFLPKPVFRYRSARRNTTMAAKQPKVTRQHLSACMLCQC